MLKVGDKNTILGLDCDSWSGCKIDLLWFWGGEVEETYFFRDLPFSIHLFKHSLRLPVNNQSDNQCVF